VGDYYSFLENREKAIKRINNEYREAAGQRLKSAIINFTGQYKSIERIFIFGSFVNGDFNRYSDIDIYMEGLSAADYYDARRKLEDMLGIDMDLYTDGDQKDFIEKIKRKGVLVYERETGITDFQPS